MEKRERRASKCGEEQPLTGMLKHNESHATHTYLKHLFSALLGLFTSLSRLFSYLGKAPRALRAY